MGYSNCLITLLNYTTLKQVDIHYANKTSLITLLNYTTLKPQIPNQRLGNGPIQNREAGVKSNQTM